MNTFEEKRAARVERMRARAGSNIIAAATIQSSTEALRGCMNGTPILRGHHSERRHRRDLEKLHAKDKKQYELVKGAEDLQRRADAAEANTAISTDDPDALEKLRAKLAETIEMCARVKADVSRARKATKGKPTLGWRAAMVAAGVSPRFIETVITCGWVPTIAGNASASVKRIADRNSADIFGDTFRLLASLGDGAPTDSTKALARKFWTMAERYDFAWEEMRCDAELNMLGLCDYSGDEVVYGPGAKAAPP